MAVLLLNLVGCLVSQLIWLIRGHLQDSNMEFDGNMHLRKSGVCIGSNIAPLLSNVFLMDTSGFSIFKDKSLTVKSVFRYTDGLVIVNCYRNMQVYAQNV